jgi:hypothetical protein
MYLEATYIMPVFGSHSQIGKSLKFAVLESFFKRASVLEFFRQFAKTRSSAHKNKKKPTASNRTRNRRYKHYNLYPTMPPLSSFDTMEMQSSFVSLASTEDVDFDMEPKATIAPPPQRSSITKCLGFHMYDEVIEIPHIDDISDDEVDATWYSKKEFQTIRKSCLRTVELMERKLSIKESSKHYCTRGLEKHTDLGRQIRKRHQEVCFETVMNIQDLSESRGVALNDIMAEFYAKTCSESVQEALRWASQDEREVRRMMR